jgi:acetyltransferase-like isoleucine patch superfamily enzyme
VRGLHIPDSIAIRARRLAADAVNSGWQKLSSIGAVGPGNKVARRFGEFGDGSLLGFPLGVFYNEEYIRIGSQTMIGPYASITVGMAPGQKMVTNPVVAIGDRCVIGRGSHIIGHFSIEIGDEVQTGPNVYITDQNHAYDDPDVPVGRQWPVDNPVSIGSGAWLGTAVVVLPGSSIGRNAVIGAGSVVTGEIPDHCVAVGVPAKVVKRYEPGEGWVKATHQAPRLARELSV